MFLEVLVGLSGSGKSTYAMSHSSENCVHLSSDAIRKEFFGSESVQQDHDKVFNEMVRRARIALGEGKSVIYDSTGLSYKSRKQIVSMARDKFPSCEIIATVVRVPLEVCIARNQGRERKVDEEVIRRQMRHFQMPSYFEGFTKINLFPKILPPQWTVFFSEYKEQMKDFDQKNIHHSLTLGQHCQLTQEKVLALENDETLGAAASFHDVGKLKTQTFDENGMAHYYDHQNVSAYLILLTCPFCFDPNLLAIASYITWHMLPYFINSEKTENKYRSLMGNDFYNKLLAFNKADLAAH